MYKNIVRSKRYPGSSKILREVLMKKVRYVCKKCGYRFVAEVLEPGEAEEKRLSTRPVLCERCKGPVERD